MIDYKKRLDYVTDSLLSEYLKIENPEWRELINVYMKYLDERVYQNVINIIYANDINKLKDEVFIDELFNQQANGIVNEELIRLDTDMKKQFIVLSNLINNLKGTKSSVDYFLRYAAHAQIQDVSRNFILEDLAVNIQENQEITVDPLNPKLFDKLMEYRYETANVYDRLPEVLKNVTPAGVGYSVYSPTALTYTESATIACSGTTSVNVLFKYNGLNGYFGLYGSPAFEDRKVIETEIVDYPNVTINVGGRSVVSTDDYIWSHYGSILYKISSSINQITPIFTISDYGFQGKDLVYDGTYLWLSEGRYFYVSGGNSYYSANIKKISPTLNTIITSISSLSSNSYELLYFKDYLWGASKNVIKISPTVNNIVATISDHSGYTSLSHDLNYIWAGYGSNYLAKISPTLNAVSATYYLSKNITSMAFDGNYLWINAGSYNQSNIFKFSVTSNTIVATVSCGQGPLQIMYDGEHIWTRNDNGSVHSISKISPTLNRTLYTSRSDIYTHDIDYDDNYIIIGGQNYINKINKDLDLLLASVTVGTNPTNIANKNNYIYVVNHNSDDISKINLTTNQVTNTIVVGNKPTDITINDYIWVTNSASNNVTKISQLSNDVLATIPVGVSPRGITSDTNYVWVANRGTDNITKINSSSNTISATIDVGYGVVDVLCDDDYVWCANQYSSNVNKISITSNAIVNTFSDLINSPTVLSKSDEYLWIGGYNQISKYNTGTQHVISSTISFGYDVTDSVHVGDNILAYISDVYSSLINFDVKNNVEVGEYSLIDNHMYPSSVKYLADYNWVNCNGGGHLKVSPTTNEIVDTITISNGNVGEILEYDGEYLLVGGTSAIYKMSPTTNEIVATISLVSNRSYHKIVSVGDYIWTGSYEYNYGSGGYISDINKISSLSGSIEATISISGDNFLSNLLRDIDDNIWCSKYYQNILYKISSTMDTIVEEIDLGFRITDVSYDGEYLWIFSDETDNIYKFSTINNTIVDYFNGGGFKNGLIVTSDYIYKVQSFYTGGYDDILGIIQFSKYDYSEISRYDLGAYSSEYGLTNNDDDIYLTKYNSNCLYKIDGINQTKERISFGYIGSGPREIVYEGEYFWILSNGSNNIIQVSSTTFELLNEVPIGTNCVDMIYAEEHLWVISAENYFKITKVSLSPFEVVDVYSFPFSFNDITYGGDYLWLNGYGEYLYQIDLYGNLIHEFETLSTECSTFDGEYIWVPSYDGYLYKIDTFTSSIIDVVYLETTNPVDIYLDIIYFDNYLWIGTIEYDSVLTKYMSNIYKVSPTLNVILDEFNYSKGADYVSLVGAENYIFSYIKTNTKGKKITLDYDLPLVNINMGNDINALDWDGDYLYATCTNSVLRINATTDTVLTTISTGTLSYGLSHDNDNTYIANYGSGNVVSLKQNTYTIITNTIDTEALMVRSTVSKAFGDVTVTLAGQFTPIFLFGEYQI